MKVQKEYLKLLEKMSEMSHNALDTFAQLSEAATHKSENLLRQQMEMFQLTSSPNMSPLSGATEITEIVFKSRERLARQQLDMLKLTLESGADFLTERSDNANIKETMKAQRLFAEGLSDKILDSVKSNIEICFDTHSEINQVVQRKLASGKERAKEGRRQKRTAPASKRAPRRKAHARPSPSKAKPTASRVAAPKKPTPKKSEPVSTATETSTK